MSLLPDFGHQIGRGGQVTERDEGYVQALQRMVAHCQRLMLDRETPMEGRKEHRALIDFMEGQIEQMQERDAGEDARRIAV